MIKKIFTYSLVCIITAVSALTTPVFAQQSQQEVVDWMFENNYTIYDAVDQFWRNQRVTRWQVSKFMLRFAEAQWKAKVRTPEECQFDDLEWYDYTLVPTIIAACEYWIVKWFQWSYMPNNPVTEAEMVTMLVRILMWNHDETTSPRRYRYYEVAVWSEIINPNDKSVRDLDTPALRWTVGTWLYKWARVDSEELKEEWQEELKQPLEEIFGEGVVG